MADKQSDWDIAVEELARMREQGADFFLLDVREVHEVAIATSGGVHIPLGEVAQRIDEIPRDSQGVAALRQLGYEDVWNVAGGIHVWAERVDPDVPTY